MTRNKDNTPLATQFASPPCFAQDQDPDATALDREEIVAMLQELLEAERAGSRIAKESLDQAEKEQRSGQVLALIEQLRKDETSYCKMLMEQTRRFGATPSQATGAFYEKCMAFTNLLERFAFLNRGQGWVVKRINTMLPDLADPLLIEALTEMRDTHVSNIAQTNSVLGLK